MEINDMQLRLFDLKSSHRTKQKSNEKTSVLQTNLAEAKASIMRLRKNPSSPARAQELKRQLARLKLTLIQLQQYTARETQETSPNVQHRI